MQQSSAGPRTGFPSTSFSTSSSPGAGARSADRTPRLGERSGGNPSGGDRAGGDRITVLAGGIGAARFLRGLRLARPDARITVIGNTGDDITLYGLRVCPDLDTVLYTLAGVNNEAQGWGLANETWHALEEVRGFLGSGGTNASGGTAASEDAAHDSTATFDSSDAPDLAAMAREVPTWFGLGDRDLGTHLVRTALLQAGHPLSTVTALLTARWDLGVRLLPMTDEPVETHVTAETEGGGGTRTMHFQEYWVGQHASMPVRELAVRGIERATPAEGVLEAIHDADVILLPPSNPVVSIGPILAVPGITDAVRASAAPVVGLSPIIGGTPVRGMADKLLPAIGVETTASGVARHFGPELLDGWLVDTGDADAVPTVTDAGIACRAVPLWMSSPEAAAAMAEAALGLAAGVSPEGTANAVREERA